MQLRRIEFVDYTIQGMRDCLSTSHMKCQPSVRILVSSVVGVTSSMDIYSLQNAFVEAPTLPFVCSLYQSRLAHKNETCKEDGFKGETHVSKRGKGLGSK